jgi:hypothetical protein
MNSLKRSIHYLTGDIHMTNRCSLIHTKILISGVLAVKHHGLHNQCDALPQLSDEMLWNDIQFFIKMSINVYPSLMSLLGIKDSLATHRGGATYHVFAADNLAVMNDWGSLRRNLISTYITSQLLWGERQVD